MSSISRYCRCCYSSETLERLCGDELDVFKLICNPQDLYDDDTQIVACIQCREFLKEVKHFRIKCCAVDEVFRKNLDIKPNEVELHVKTEIFDEYDEIEQIDVQIRKVEIDFEPENQNNLFRTKTNQSNSTLVELLCKPISNSAHSTENPFKCDNCSFKCEEKQQMITHQIIHFKTGSADKCEETDRICEMEINSEHPNEVQLDSNIENNNRKEFDDQLFSCELCSFTTVWKNSLKSHTQLKHSDERPYACNQCNYRAKTKCHLSVHVKSHLDDSDKPFKCSECPYKAAIWGNMKYHIMRKHNDNKPFTCDQCNYRGSFKSELVRHKRTHLDDPDKPFKCSECSYKSISRNDLKMHTLYKHSDEKPFACDQCDHRMKFKFQLVRHMKTHSPDENKTFKCRRCSYQSQTQSELRIHIVNTHNDKPFSCDQCGYHGSLKSKLVRHKKKHLNDVDKPFKCDQCSYKSATQYEMKMHTQYKHSDERPFSCDQCDYHVKFKCQLARHMLSHSTDAEKPFKCGECSYHSLTRNEMKVHALCKHSDEKPFKCDQCDYRGKLKKQLARHKKKHLKEHS